jgi:D-arabinose 1-dehydrogenase-like Zn-dependent alcohol dehydrogenase
LKGVDYIYDTVDVDSNFDQLAPLLNPLGKFLAITISTSRKPINYATLFVKRATLTFESMFARYIELFRLQSSTK